jgi:penicillin amidase
MRSRPLRTLLRLTAVLLVVGLGAGFWVHGRLRASLPQLDGRRQVAGLNAEVTVTRDALGIPTIRGGSREDVARALGFLHAQDRFFQMDLARRRAAGELAALFGARAIEVDRETRVHRFRAMARRAVALIEPADRRVLDAYAGGVQSGLSALGAAPFEYLVLRQDPRPWLTEDSLLVVLSMFLTLQEQDADGSYESMLATLHEVLPPAMAAFLSPPGTEWDAPIVGEPFAVPPVPGADVYNLRARRQGKRGVDLPERQPGIIRDIARRVGGGVWDLGFGLWDSRFGIWDLGFGIWDFGLDSPSSEAVGSNNWAVAGSLTADGGALLANDMHLAVRVPGTWYRARLEWPDPSQPGATATLVGLTLPGVPALVVGSNTRIAWGFTNTFADWSDNVILDVDPGDTNRYRTPGGWRRFERHDEVIEVAGQPAEHLPVAWTIWGPRLAPDHRGRARALRWVAHSAEHLAKVVRPIESARTVEEAVAGANGVGVPGQNLVVADRSGRIAWSVFGAIPRRIGLDGRLPASWADGSHGWDGWLDPREYPRVLDPPGGRIWTANARVVGGDMLARLGDGSYEVGSRAHAIRSRLMAGSRFTARDMLDIQLDARADFLARWRDLILRTLTPAAVAANADRQRVRDIVARDWDGVASPGSRGYLLTRLFRADVFERVIAFVLAECYEADPAFEYRLERRREGPIWALVTEQPPHLLDPAFTTWDELLLAAIDRVIARTPPGELATRVWSDYNVAAFRHPLSSGLPLVGRWLDMPLRPLPGDLYTPRMLWRAETASERMVVSPGRESAGILHMPAGQSGHPLSPFYANSHPAWVDGEPTPFLPGPPVHTLTLTP